MLLVLREVDFLGVTVDDSELDEVTLITSLMELVRLRDNDRLPKSSVCDAVDVSEGDIDNDLPPRLPLADWETSIELVCDADGCRSVGD